MLPFGTFVKLTILLSMLGTGSAIWWKYLEPVEPPEGFILSSTCSGTTLTVETADGVGGSIINETENSSQCGYVPPPTAGTVLDQYCVETTLYTETADGEGGVLTTKQAESETCGYVPPEHPPFGTLLNEGCSQDFPGVKWEIYADGEGGTYTIKEENSTYCGWTRPTLVLRIAEESDGVGDRFTAAIVDVEYTNWLGEEEPWGMDDVSSTIGWTQRRGNQIYIWGDGRLGDGILTVGKKEIMFYMEEEPVCGHTRESNGVTYDCQGHRVKSSTKPFIYYGDDNEFVVPWEYTVLEYMNHSSNPDVQEGIDPDGWAEVGDNRWNKWQRKVDYMNKLLKNSGVFIEIQLVGVGRAHYHGLRNLERIVRGLETDLVIGHGTSNPDTCGIAYPNTRFSKGEPVVGMSRCGWKTDLHELGHAVGLAHGPENQAYASSGYIFPDFGHGWNDYCGNNDDIMSYGYNDNGFGNSDQLCGDQYPDTYYEDQPAGYRDYHDSAYHLNRVRFDVGLIHPEFDYVDPEEPQAAPDRKETKNDERPLIVD
jgi:hypothetical protein